MGESVRTNVKGMSIIILRVLSMGIVCAAVIILMGILGGNHLETIKREINFVTTYTNLFVILVFGITISTYYIKIFLSFGSTRKGYLIGKNICNLCLIMLAVLFDVLTYVLVDKFEMKTILLLIAMMFFLTAMGNIIGTVITKYGMKGYIGMVIFCGICGGFVGGFSSSNVIKKIFEFKYISAISLIAGLFMYIIMTFVEAKMIDRYEIK